MQPPQQQPSPSLSGIWHGLGCYGLWGLLPLYFLLLAFAGPIEIVAHRTLWSLLFCLALLPFRRGFAHVWATLRNRRQLGTLAIAAALVASNWLVYVYAVLHQQVVQASMGYFINPLITVLLGVLLLKETLRPAQWWALGVSLVAIVVLTVDYGHVPWIGLFLAVSFGLYALTKNRVGREVGAITSLSVETLLLAPLALLFLLWLDHRGQGHFLRDGTSHTLLLMSAGIVTAVPLVFFAAAARRLSMTMLGLMQYMTPTIQFLLGVYVLGEAMPASRWIGFALIWVALAIISLDGWRNHRARLHPRLAEVVGNTRPPQEPVG